MNGTSLKLRIWRLRKGNSFREYYWGELLATRSMSDHWPGMDRPLQSCHVAGVAGLVAVVIVQMKAFFLLWLWIIVIACRSPSY